MVKALTMLEVSSSLNIEINFLICCQKSKTPVVTTAEVSSDESTKAESPEQPQAVTMTTQPKASLSTVQCSTLTLAHLPGASKMIQWASKTPVKLARSGNQMFCSCPARN